MFKLLYVVELGSYSRAGVTAQQRSFYGSCGTVKEYGGCEAYCGDEWAGKASRAEQCYGQCFSKCGH